MRWAFQRKDRCRLILPLPSRAKTSTTTSVPSICTFACGMSPGLTVYHPEFQSIERLRQKTYGYALGVGYVLRVNRYSSWTLGDVLLRSLAGSAVSLCGVISGVLIFTYCAQPGSYGDMFWAD